MDKVISENGHSYALFGGGLLGLRSVLVSLRVSRPA